MEAKEILRDQWVFTVEDANKIEKAMKSSEPFENFIGIGVFNQIDDEGEDGFFISDYTLNGIHMVFHFRGKTDKDLFEDMIKNLRQINPEEDAKYFETEGSMWLSVYDGDLSHEGIVKELKSYKDYVEKIAKFIEMHLKEVKC